MDRLSNIVKQRLAAQQVASGAEHVPADTLAAFAEQGLRAVEKQRVLSHLAVCSECRQILALAASVEQVSPAPPQGRSYVSGFPAAIRWASAAAAFAVAIGIGVLSYEHQNRPQFAASAPAQTQKKATPPAAQPTEGNSEAVSDQTTARNSASPNSRSRVIADASTRKTQPALKKEQRGGVLGGIVGASQAKSVFGTSKAVDGFMASNVPAPPPRPSAASAKAIVSTFSDASAAPGPATTVVPAAPAQLRAEARSNVQVADVGSASNMNKPEFQGPATVSLPQQPASSATMKNVASSAIGGTVGSGAIHGFTPIAHWTISSNGKLQRRTGDGRFTSIEPAPGVSIHAVAAQGIEVWAAGSQPDLSAKQWQQRPVLFHSSDAGQTWMQISGPWESPITTLNLADPNILTVVTADGTWTTTDAGKNWIKK